MFRGSSGCASLRRIPNFGILSGDTCDKDSNILGLCLWKPHLKNLSSMLAQDPPMLSRFELKDL